MSVVYGQRRGLWSRVRALGETDFCPWANRYVYWLKEPIGWFAVAGLLSCLVGAFVNSHGWVLLAVILSIMTVGVAWPWVAVRTVEGCLEPAVDCVHEGSRVDLIFRLRNFLPLPQVGISVDGFLDSDIDTDVATPSVALSMVPGLSEASYRVGVMPQQRGHYPVRQPSLACAFPFGLWTARRPLKHVKPLTVWPQVVRILDDVEFGGGSAADSGEGTRSGQAGEPLGVRGFRRGDRLRNVHWVHTARTGQVVVCERGGPQRQEVELILDARLGVGEAGSCDSSMEQESLTWRVRLIASLAMQLHARHIHLTLVLGGVSHRIACSNRGRKELLDLLAAVPKTGLATGGEKRLMSGKRMRIRVSPHNLAGRLRVDFDGGNERLTRGVTALELAWDEEEFLERIARFWREVRHATRAA